MLNVENQYAEEAQQRWPEQFAESQKRVAKLGKDEMAAIMQQHEGVAVALADLLLSGAQVADLAVQEQVAKHYDWVCNFWTPNREAYLGLGRMYVEDERFRQNYDKHANGTAQFLCDAIAASQIPAS